VSRLGRVPDCSNPSGTGHADIGSGFGPGAIGDTEGDADGDSVSPRRIPNAKRISIVRPKACEQPKRALEPRLLAGLTPSRAISRSLFTSVRIHLLMDFVRSRNHYACVRSTIEPLSSGSCRRRRSYWGEADDALLLAEGGVAEVSPMIRHGRSRCGGYDRRCRTRRSRRR
jgi:hypothetical protein